MRSNVVAPIAAGILLAAAGSAVAANKTTTFTVSAAVAANCNITAAPIEFGNYDGSGVLTKSGDIKVRCSNGTGYTVKLSTGGSAAYAQRLLSDGTNTLEYNLYTTAGFGSIWGDGVSATSVIGGTGSGMSSSQEKTHTVYGRLPNSLANQDAPVGGYTDTITVTIEY